MKLRAFVQYSTKREFLAIFMFPYCLMVSSLVHVYVFFSSDCNKVCSKGDLNEACDACICDSSVVKGRVVSRVGNPLDDAVIMEESAPTKIIATSNSTGFFSLNGTCVTSTIIVSRFGFQDKVVQISDEHLQLIEMDLEGKHASLIDIHMHVMIDSIFVVTALK